MQAPDKIAPQSTRDYFEVLCRAMFQAGLPWKVVAAKWDGIREAFAGFDPVRVAELDDHDIEDLLADSRVIRHRAKIRGAVANARRILELEATPGGFSGWLRSHHDFDDTVKAMRAKFRYVGETSAYYFLWVVDEPVPAFEEWAAGRDWKPKVSSRSPQPKPARTG